MDKIAKIERLKLRTRELSLSILKFYQQLPKTGEAKIFGNQLLRSATSVGANYRAACRARSNAEFYSKLCIVVEEIDEVDYWLDLIQAANIMTSESTGHLIDETNELIKVFVTIKSNARRKKG